MYLDSYFDEINTKEVRFFQKVGGTFTTFYHFWRDNLFERVMRLFVWSGTGEVPAKEIEIRLLLAGHCGIADLVSKVYPEQNGLTAFFGTFHGVSKYFDEKPNYTIRSPIHAGDTKIGEDVAIISNNSLRNPTMPVIEHYAYLLAHTEVTLSDVLIEARDAGGVPVATSTKQLNTIISYQKKLYNGEHGAITDNGALGVEYAGVSRQTSQNVVDVLETRQKLLKNFYADIGVRASFDKRSNTVVNEIEADTSMLLLNDADMLNKRKEGAQAVNDLFGVNWSVELAPEIRYSLQPQETGGDGR